MFKKIIQRVQSAFGQPKSADTIGDRMRAVDEYRADLARRGLVERPPNAERFVGSSDWIQRRGSRRRRQWIKESLMVGHKPDYRATHRH